MKTTTTEGTMTTKTAQRRFTDITDWSDPLLALPKHGGEILTAVYRADGTGYFPVFADVTKVQEGDNGQRIVCSEGVCDEGLYAWSELPREITSTY